MAVRTPNNMGGILRGLRPTLNAVEATAHVNVYENGGDMIFLLPEKQACAPHRPRPYDRALPRRKTPTTASPMMSGSSLTLTRMGSKSAFSGMSHTTGPSCL